MKFHQDSAQRSFGIGMEDGASNMKNIHVLEKVSAVSSLQQPNENYYVPAPPPLPPPGFTFPSKRRYQRERCLFLRETQEMWDKMFKEGYGADVHVLTKDESTIVPAHSSVLSVASSVFSNILQQTKPKNNIRQLKILGVPHRAVYTFIRFLYSSCYEEEDMRNFVLQLLVLSHSYSVPLLKRVCVQFMEQGWLTTENVIDVLYMAKKCDAPRLSYICISMVVRDFKTIALSDGWKVMRRVNPLLEQELLEAVVEADCRRQERLQRIEEKKVYMHLYEAMKALLHICKEGCKTIGPRDKMLKPGSQVGASCDFPACKGVEMLVRHFSTCKTRVPGGCVHCKRMWQLLELHSCMCNEPDSCNVPLCRQFKEKMRQQSKKDEVKWKLLVSKVIAAKSNQSLFLGRLLSLS